MTITVRQRKPSLQFVSVPGDAARYVVYFGREEDGGMGRVAIYSRAAGVQNGMPMVSATRARRPALDETVAA